MNDRAVWEKVDAIIAAYGQQEYRRGIEAILSLREVAKRKAIGWFCDRPPQLYDVNSFTLALSLFETALEKEAARLLEEK